MVEIIDGTLVHIDDNLVKQVSAAQVKRCLFQSLITLRKVYDTNQFSDASERMLTEILVDLEIAARKIDLLIGE